MTFTKLFGTQDAVNKSPPLNVVAISGSLAPPSKTRTLVDAVVARLAAHREISTKVIDLAEIGSTIATVTSRKSIAPEVEALYAAVESADLLIVGSPIYKASYTGLFKHFFDLISPTALSGVPVVLTGTGGSERHALALEHQFRPLFGFFNASTLPTTIYAVETDFANGALSQAVEARIARVISEFDGTFSGQRNRTEPVRQLATA